MLWSLKFTLVITGEISGGHSRIFQRALVTPRINNSLRWHPLKTSLAFARALADIVIRSAGVSVLTLKAYVLDLLVVLSPQPTLTITSM